MAEATINIDTAGLQKRLMETIWNYTSEGVELGRDFPDASPEYIADLVVAQVEGFAANVPSARRILANES